MSRKEYALIVCFCLIIVSITACGQGEEVGDSDEISASVEAFKNRKIYRQLNVEILQAIPDEKVEMAIVDYIWAKLGDNWDREREIVVALPPAFRAMHATCIVEAEVNNGGYNQFFWNSSGQWANEAVRGFRMFGAREHAELTEQAIRQYEKEKTMQEELRAEGTAEAFSEAYELTGLNELDERFYSLGENLSSLRIAYIRSHPEEFVGE